MGLEVVLVVIVAFGISLLFVVNKPGKKSMKKSRGNAFSLDKDFVQNKWQEIEAGFSLGGPSQIKNAIMEADKLVDHVLKSSGVAGTTMGERLKNARSKFKEYSDYDNLWKAHKLRNNIAHESSHDLVLTEAKRAMEHFKKALKILGAL